MIQNCKKKLYVFWWKKILIPRQTKQCIYNKDWDSNPVVAKCLKYLCYHLSLSFEKQVQKDRQIRFAKSIKQANYKITVVCIFQCDILPCNGRNTVNRDETKKSYFTADIIVHLQ